VGAVVAGFVTIVSIIGLGVLLAQLRILDVAAQHMLTRLTFSVAGPALMITVLGRTDVSRLFSANLFASIGAVVLSAGSYLLLARLVWRRSAADTVIGAFASCYVNAGNLGLPIAAYVLHDASQVVPTLITQLILLQPLGLAALDVISRAGEPKAVQGRAFSGPSGGPGGGGGTAAPGFSAPSGGPGHGGSTVPQRRRRLLRLTQPLGNPLLIGALIGLLLSVLHVELPAPVHDPLALVAGMAVPAMLLAYGVSLRTGPLPGAGEPPAQIAVIVALKLVVQPLAAFLLARYVLGLHSAELLAVTVVAALPTAQNVFTFAVRYRQGEVLARDTIFVTTLASVPVLLLIAGVLG
jgi:predicted permease